MNMKKMILALLAVLCIGTVGFAAKTATTTAANATYSKNPPEMQTFTGKVGSLTICTDPYCGNRSEIVVVDAKGNKMTFAVRTGIGVTVLSSDKLGSLKDLMKGDIVTIEYIINKDGTNKAMTIFATK
jgi:hypothetical protein